MSEVLEFCENRASAAQIAAHLEACDEAFKPPLSSRVRVDDYAQKIRDRAERFEAWTGEMLVGLVAAYCNDKEGRVAFITSVSVLPERQGAGIASMLLARCISHAAGLRFTRVELELDQRNTPAVSLYVKHGFRFDRQTHHKAIMSLAIERECK